MVLNKIKKIVKNDSFIYLDDFIRTVLQDHDSGYYTNKNPIGKKGDFITAPEVSQLYGEILALSIVNKILQKGILYFNLLELGPGKGTLMKDIVRIFKKTLDKNISYSIHFNEINRNYKKELRIHFPNCKFNSNFNNLTEDYLIVIANEFFDAMPICQFSLIKDEIFETVIRIDENEDLFFDKYPARKEIVDEADCQVKLSKNLFYEYSQETNKIFKNLSELIKKNGGFMLVADYGYIKPIIKSTLQSISKNQKTQVLNNIGNQDITCHVNFHKLVNIAENLGLKNIHLNTQGNYLKMNGINIRAEKLIKSNSNKSEKIINELSRLIDPDKMGNLFKILEAEY